MGGLFSSGKKAARIQAAATMDSANMQAKSDAYVAQAATQQSQTIIAQTKAAAAASELLSAPMEKVDVNLAPDAPDAAIDPTTGRRQTVRSTFQSSSPSGSGIKI